MPTQNNAGIVLPQDLADHFPTSLMSAIAHIQVARDWLHTQKDELDHLPAKQKKSFRSQITTYMLDINELDDRLCELLFDIFACGMEGLPKFPKSILL